MGTLIAEISTFVHILAAAAFFVFAFFEIFAALKPGSKIPSIGSFLLFAGGISGLAFMFSKTGGTPDAFFDTISKESIFMLFSGFFLLLSTSGLIGIMQYLSKSIPGFWKLFQMLLFCFVAVCFYVYPKFYAAETDPLIEQLHHVMAYAAIAGSAVCAINVFLKNKFVAFLAVFCFLISGILLVQFRENPNSFLRQTEFSSSVNL